MHLKTVTGLTAPLAGSRLEDCRTQEDSGGSLKVKGVEHLPGIDKRSTEEFKGLCGAAPFGHVGAFPQDLTRVNHGRCGRGQVR